ncbi:MAG: protein-L-isoaspartate O-methyltransferase [Pseudomonadota bacterium]
MPDYSSLRTQMVDTQVRPSDVTKFPIIEAMLTVPRELFVPDALRATAYAGETLDIAQDRVMLEPRTLAKMLDALDIDPADLVLDVGAGLGYAAAVMARMAVAVVALEDDETKVSDAEAVLAEAGVDNVAVVSGPLEAGAPKHGPYDVITIQGGVETVPAALLDQLKDGGRIGAVFMDGALGTCRIGHKFDGRVTWRYAFNAAAPVLPTFRMTRAFAL